MPSYVTSDRCQCLAILTPVNQASAMPGADFCCCRCLNSIFVYRRHLDILLGERSILQWFFNDSDKAIIEACVMKKGWSGNRIVKEFPTKYWTRQFIYQLVQKIKDTGSSARQQWQT